MVTALEAEGGRGRAVGEREVRELVGVMRDRRGNGPRHMVLAHEEKTQNRKSGTKHTGGRND